MYTIILILKFGCRILAVGHERHLIREMKMRVSTKTFQENLLILNNGGRSMGFRLVEFGGKLIFFQVRKVLNE